MNISRRRFLQSGGALVISFNLPAAIGPALAADEQSFAPNAYIRIDPDGRVSVTVAYVEMGQGTYTSIPMLIAEELEVPLSSVRVEHAPADERFYGNPLLGGIQATGNSNAVRGAWEPMRRAGAVARTLLVQAAAQRWKVDAASCRAEKGAVIHAASGRRLGYGALVAAAAQLPVPAADSVKLKPRGEFKLIGTPAKRLDIAGKVNGTAQYGIDAKLPGMKVATIAISPVIGGKLRHVDDTAAKAVRGVRQIVRLDDAVAVVADHMGAAKKGLAALKIEWDDGPNAHLSSAELLRDMEAASSGAGAVARKEGDVAKALAGAARHVEAVYGVPFFAHATMEPMNATVHVRKDGCEIWTGTQVMARVQAAAAKLTGLPLEKVTVHNHLLGGGFGRRLEVDGVVRAVQVAMQVDAPVKLVYTRETDIQHDMYKPAFHDRLAAGLDAQGMPVAWSHRLTGSSVMARWVPPAFQKGLDPDTIEGAAEPPYALPNMLVEYVQHEPRGIQTAFWRGVGPVHNVFVVESFMDELAAKAGKDPLAYRRAIADARAKAVLDLAASKSGWGKPLPKGTGRGIAVQSAFGSYLAQVAEVEVSRKGEVRVRRVVCAVDCGPVVNPDTVRAQMQSGIVFGLSAALYGEITLKDGRVEQTNFLDYRVLRINEMPRVDVYIVDSNAAPGGIGETATSCVMPALTNAIFAATGKRIRKLPVGDHTRAL
jgi:isoquinoline 1-oxidoreductase beta subunit